MIKFLDLDTGYSFDGFWKNDQVKGYTFWFPDAQSTNISYSMPICLLTDDPKKITLTFEENEFFNFLIDANTDCTIDGYIFKEPKLDSKIVIGTTKDNTDTDILFEQLTEESEIQSAWYGCMIYVIAKSKHEGEFICKINIGDEGFIRVGADFYGEYEPTKINLANFGVEIPGEVQKSIYCSNVHEDQQDNILVNRKFKELLSNYWDIVANKGSYKSLVNSLKWFEWGDLLRIREIWRRNDAGINMFIDRELSPIFEGKSTDYFDNYIKTTYVSLYCSLLSENDTYDIEENPTLSDVVFKWSKDDIHLKLSLLSQFFGTFFLPIHMSVLHCTAEDTIFTNAIKTVVGNLMNRCDSIEDFTTIQSNVKSTYILSNVKTGVKPDTIFANVNKNSIIDRFGVDIITDDEIQLVNQYYGGPGVVIPIELTIPNRTYGEFVVKTLVNYNGKNYEFNKVFRRTKDYIKIGFNFLATESKDYTIDFVFVLSSGKALTKRVEFTVKDIDNVVLNVYKIQSKNDSEGFTYEDFHNESELKSIFKIQNNSNINSPYIQYLPYSMQYDNEYKGIKLNRTVVFKCENVLDGELNSLRDSFKDYLEFHKHDDERLTYLIFVSKKFNEVLPSFESSNSYSIIRNDLGFYPQFHTLSLIEGNTIDDYTVNKNEALCCAAEIRLKNENLPLKYGNAIDKTEWEFHNITTGKTIELNSSSQQPFIAGSKGILDPGYYGITFRYKLSNETYKITYDSVFRVR